MKNISKLLVASAAVIALAATVHADPTPGERNFGFTANDSHTHGGDNRTRTRFRRGDIDTTVTVNPYLLVNAQLGGDWTVDGWGAGTGDTGDGSQSIEIFHSDPVTMRGDNWRNPKDHESGRSIDMTVTGTAVGADNTDIIPPVTEPIPVTSLNQTFTFSPDSNPAASPFPATGGHVKFNFTFHLNADASTYSGHYTIHPTEYFQLELPETR